MRALAIAATGMNAQQTNMEVIANNMANINTTGFKRSRAEFTDLLYQAERAVGAPARGGANGVPEGSYVGLGVRTAAIRGVHIQGALKETGNSLDVGLNGNGWFQITGADGNTYYSRGGRLQQERQRRDRDARRLSGAAGHHDSERRQERDDQRIGEVFATLADGTSSNLGQITLANFVNEAGLEPMGSNLYRSSEGIR